MKEYQVSHLAFPYIFLIFRAPLASCPLLSFFFSVVFSSLFLLCNCSLFCFFLLFDCSLFSSPSFLSSVLTPVPQGHLGNDCNDNVDPVAPYLRAIDGV